MASLHNATRSRNNVRAPLPCERTNGQRVDNDLKLARACIAEGYAYGAALCIDAATRLLPHVRSKALYEMLADDLAEVRKAVA